ncbi:hypothetical protein CHARACLAT_018115 [Characodon lateralis]|uniref:Uncharacterized protein n=1 Tax=Characodon lateralis TaxID=208331 RepID=A0ABU7DTV0_9TELE|nr:hypothetical protein [Characodon lateralis]
MTALCILSSPLSPPQHPEHRCILAASSRDTIRIHSISTAPTIALPFCPFIYLYVCLWPSSLRCLGFHWNEMLAVSPLSISPSPLLSLSHSRLVCVSLSDIIQ